MAAEPVTARDPVGVHAGGTRIRENEPALARLRAATGALTRRATRRFAHADLRCPAGPGTGGRRKIAPMSAETVAPETAAEPFSPLRWAGGGLQLLDQTRLPVEEVWMDCTRPEQVADAIRRLAVRGAPAIGVAAGYGLVLAIQGVEDAGEQQARFAVAEALLGATRPTAVNLRWALAGGRRVYEASRGQAPAERVETLLSWARRIHAEGLG